MKRTIKHYLKNSPWVFNILVNLIFFYLKFAYFTSKWQVIFLSNLDKKQLNEENGILFALWHNRLAYSLHIFGNYENVFGLVSPHSDGKIISKLISLMKHKIIEGSTNKDSTLAIREIIKQITAGHKIVVTPDGPRGPVYKNGSIITKIASKYNKKLIPVSCYASSYFELKSWDKMMFPKPFSRVIVIMGEPLELSGSEESDKLLLEQTLNDLSEKSKQYLLNQYKQ